MRWAELRLKCKLVNCFTIASTYDDKLAALAVFHDFKQNSVEIDFVCDNPKGMTRAFCKAVSTYVFGNWRRATCFTTPEHKAAQRLIERLGFKREGIQRKAADDGRDLIMYGILKEESKF